MRNQNSKFSVFFVLEFIFLWHFIYAYHFAFLYNIRWDKFWLSSKECPWEFLHYKTNIVFINGN